MSVLWQTPLGLSVLRQWALASMLVWTAAGCFGQDSGATDTGFNQSIRPLLSNHCFACHGPDAEHREAGLRLDLDEGTDFDEVLRRIQSTDPDEMMPPPHINKPLAPTQIQTLHRWIKAGAKYETHWSFAGRSTETLPDGRLDWSSQPIDRLVAAGWSSDQQANETADRRTLLRRLSFDLTGLPPTREELAAFLQDEAPDAYERRVDEWMAREQYGEHMARYWLDLVRFADTNGLHHDHYRDMSPYRDWVIRAFNQNQRFDEFIVDQVAGDLRPNPTEEQLIGSGFNRLHLIIDRGTALPEESFHRNVVDRVTAVGTAFMGLTVQCAVCHDHKYDPITQKEFYQLYAFFNNFDGGPETGPRNGTDFTRGLQPPYLDLATDDQQQQQAAFKSQLAELATQLKQLNQKKKRLEATSKPTEPPKQSSNPKAAEQSTGFAQPAPNPALDELNQRIQQTTKKKQQLQKQLDALMLDIPGALIMKERAEVRPTFVLERGVYDQPGEAVQRGTPSFLPPLTTPGNVPNRLDLAKWLVAPEHPLTARVTVNRIWQQFFGVGLVKTSEDFGAQGEPPSHPELLDYLAQDLIDSGWDIKRMVKRIVMTQTYRQSSRASEADYLRDPENRRLARGSRFRLDAEMIRDQLLAVSGQLNRDLYGKSVKPPQPAGIWEIVAMPSSYPRVYQADTGDKIYRRSLYTFWKRAIPPPQMTIFDAPTRESCIARRERTNTPLQALVLMNEEQYFSAAMRLASTLLADPQLADDESRIDAMFESVTSQLPDRGQRARLKSALNQFRTKFQNTPDLAVEMIKGHSQEMPVEPDQVHEWAAWSMLTHAVFNLDASRTRE